MLPPLEILSDPPGACPVVQLDPDPLVAYSCDCSGCRSCSLYSVGDPNAISDLVINELFRWALPAHAFDLCDDTGLLDAHLLQLVNQLADGWFSITLLHEFCFGYFLSFNVVLTNSPLRTVSPERTARLQRIPSLMVSKEQVRETSSY